MGPKTAAAGAAINTQNSTKCLLIKNCIGKIRFSDVVNTPKCCCAKNKIKTTPLVTNSPIVCPLFHAYTVPPKLMAMMPARLAPGSRIDPSQSICFVRSIKLVPAFGSQLGTRNIRIGPKTAKRTRLM